MRFLSFKALLALIVLPPIIYVASIQGLEGYLTHYFRDDILNRIPGDTEALLNGRDRLEDQIQRGVDALSDASLWLRSGVVLSVVVRTASGRRLYPPVYGEDGRPDPVIDPMRIASENFALLNQGLDVSVAVIVDHNTTISNSVLVLAVLIALTGLVVVYRHGSRIQAREEAARRQEAERIRRRDSEQRQALTEMEAQRERLTKQIAGIQSQLADAHQRAARNETDLFDEVESLENKLHNTLMQQEEQQNRILELENLLDCLTKERQALASQQAKAAEGLRKRLETLYKQTSFTDRAISGLAEQSEPLQIKAEEIIHQLNARVDEVPVKRKLFRGKGKVTVFEIVFARKGRLYFRRTRDRRIEILTVGTKNTQDKDLVYLDRIL